MRTGVRFEDCAQDGDGVLVTLRRADGQVLRERVDVLVGADGVQSAVRARLGPDVGGGVGPAREVRRHVGQAALPAPSNTAGKFVTYHISAANPRLVNWVAEVKVAEPGQVAAADCAPGRGSAAVGGHQDVAAASPRPTPYSTARRCWSAAPYPIGSNGGSQAVLDARVLARCLASYDDPAEALSAYEDERLPPTSALVRAHRSLPVEETIALVTERAPDGFRDVADVLTEAELAAMAAAQRAISDADVRALNERESWSVRAP